MAFTSFCQFFLLVLFLAQLALVASSTSSRSHHGKHHRRHHHAAAPAVVDAPTVLASSSSAVAVRAGNDEVDEAVDDADDADDEDDDDTDDEVTIPTAVRPSKPDATLRSTPDAGDMLESNYDVGHKNDAVYVTYTPQGRVAKARQRLQDNLMKQANIVAAINEMQNEAGFQQQVDTESAALAAETQASSLAKMLGGMRKEMRRFAAPFYLDNLNNERQKLKTSEVGLQADLAAAEGALGLGHQGWPEHGQKVVVAESTFRRPVAFLGSA